MFYGRCFIYLYKGRRDFLSEKNVETEVKLIINDADMAKLMEHDIITSKALEGSHQNLHLVSTYYDTKSMFLKKNRVAYRVRKTEEAEDGSDILSSSYEATIKIDKKISGEMSSRYEFNVPVSGMDADVSVFEASELPLDLTEICGEEKPQPLFTVEVTREVLLLRITEKTLVELAIDKGLIYPGREEDYRGKVENIPVDHINEVELELKSGEIEDLMDYVEKMRGLVTVQGESRSKFVRGLALLQDK